eukprot:TRINITY_DN6739_c0_g1_i2.p1 TRINITY_DN6739_c0_g1~~TRINITY_DN6739_c0_g1_i2.p1  ORF type:complete len:844 (+),score=159.52 TRINITY_DN6739_c0_g1_i2:114-2645(+)
MQGRKGRVKLEDALKESKENWSEARQMASSIVGSNQYYFRFNKEGETQRTGPWSKEEIEMFMTRLEEYGGNVSQWGLFAKDIPGRVGYQCAAFYRGLVAKGKIKGKSSTSRSKREDVGYGGREAKASDKRSRKKRKIANHQLEDSDEEPILDDDLDEVMEESGVEDLDEELDRMSTSEIDAKPEKPKLKPKKEKIESEPFMLHPVALAANRVSVAQMDVCLACGSLGDSKDILMCIECGECYHNFCLNPPVNLHSDEMKFSWRCSHCKKCEACKNQLDEENLLVCDDCDRAFHTYCLPDPLDAIPAGEWFCHSCVYCLTCDTHVSGDGGWMNNYTQCQTCSHIPSNQLCNVCQKSLGEADKSECQVCHLSCHKSCDPRPLAASGSNYSCMKCLGAYIDRRRKNPSLFDIPSHLPQDHYISLSDEDYQDPRKCMLCAKEGEEGIEGRLINFEGDQWVHVMCVMWTPGCTENYYAQIIGFTSSLRKMSKCSECHEQGATISCAHPKCAEKYHFRCATHLKCLFTQQRTVYCLSHGNLVANTVDVASEDSFDSSRRLSIFHQAKKMMQPMSSRELRIGTLTLYYLGKILREDRPIDLSVSQTHYPIGYRVLRRFWDLNQVNKRSNYLCSIDAHSGSPLFTITPISHLEDKIQAYTLPEVIQSLLDRINTLRKKHGYPLLSDYQGRAELSGWTFFGLAEPWITQRIEMFSHLEVKPDYKRKFEPSTVANQVLEVNPSGCARCEGYNKKRLNKSGRNALKGQSLQHEPVKETSIKLTTKSDYDVKGKSSDGMMFLSLKNKKKKLRLVGSKIHHLGVIAEEPIPASEMIIEYTGQLIRNNVGEMREKKV